MNNMAAKIAGSVVAFLGWLAFIVIYLAFFTESFTFWQKLAVFIASGAILLAILIILWVKWAINW